MSAVAGGADANNELTNTLALACHADPQAEERLRMGREQNYGEFAYALACEIGAANRPPEVRQMAGSVLRNMINAKSVAFILENLQKWKALSAEQRSRIKGALLHAMASPEPMAAHSAGQAAAEIAAVELPHQEWPDFVQTLMERVTSYNSQPANEAVALAALECLGYTAERIADLDELLGDQPDLPVGVVDKMLTTIVDGVQPTRPDNMRHAAITALKNALAFVRKNMDVKSERDFILNAICEATQCNAPSVRILAYGCMDNIAEFYYDKLQDYMPAIFNLTTGAIKTDADETVKRAAIEFWSSVAWVEQSMLDEEKDCAEQGLPLDRQPCPKYAQSAMETLVPMLLETLTQQEEDVEDDEWNLQTCGANCLETISATVEGHIVPVVMPFVQQNIASENWRLRDAAILAFSAILEGPATAEIAPFVTQSIPVLLTAFGDTNVVVRDSATFCIGKICRLHIHAVPSDMLNSIIQGLLSKLGESPKVASHACSGIYELGHSFNPPGGQEMPETNLLSASMLAMLSGLLTATDRDDAVESNLRVSAMSAVTELVVVSARDVQPMLCQLLPNILERIQKALLMQVVSNDDNETKEQLLGLLCALLQVLVQRLDKSDILQHADAIMDLLLQICQSRNSSCYEEALLAVGAVASAIEEDFVKYLQLFMPALLQGLRSVQAESLCIVSLGVVVDVCGAVGNQIQPYCDQIVGALTEALKDVSASRELKPIVISCFGDIAMAIGAAYEPYLQVSVMMLMQAANNTYTAQKAEDDYLIAFFNSLRLSILEAYSGIIVGLSDGNALHLFVPNVPAILDFLRYLSTPESNRDEEVLSKAVALIGDIAQQAGTYPQVKQQINQPFVAQLIQDASAIDDPTSHDLANWTRGVVQQMCSQAS